MKIGIVGGSFDPIHFGHLIMAEHLREKKKLDKVIFIPTGYAPHKEYQNSGEIRLKMLDMAISDNEYFDSCNIEIRKNEVSYTVDTLKELKVKCPEAEFYFIIGLDNLYNLETWKKLEELGKATKFLVSNRIYEEEKSDFEIQNKVKELILNYNLKIEIVDTPIIEISSSDIRKKIKNNESINYLLPRRVLEYIETNGLYK